MKITVIGAGLGGLAAAALLAKSGHDLTVLEKNEQPGGRARVFSDKGFTFDMGPSWYLMPDVFEKFFEEFGRKPQDFYELKRLDPAYRLFFSDGTVTDVSSSFEKNFELFNSFEPNGGNKLKKYLDQARKHYALAMEELMYRDYSSIFNLMSGRLMLEGFRMPLFGSIDSFVSSVFDSEKSRRIMEYSIGFIGGSPKNTPSLYYIMNHVDLDLGVWYPKGGIGKVVEAMQKLGEQYGVKYIFNAPVNKIEVKDKKATSAVTPKGRYESDLFVVNADYAHSELDLLDNNHRSYSQKYWDTRVMAPSAIVMYIGLDKKIGKLAHHNIYLAEDWEKGFDTLFDQKRAAWPDTPSYYINVTSKTDESLAMPGGESLFILVPLAPGLEDNDQIRESYYMKIVQHLEGITGEKILGNEVTKRIFAINDFKRDYNAYKGTALGLTHTLRQTAMFRPSHRSKKVSNLYYTGHYTHPGIGMPMVTISSQILASVITKRYGGGNGG